MNHLIFHVSYRHILEEKVTPVILDIEEKARDQHQVAQADEDDHHHATVHREAVPDHLCWILPWYRQPARGYHKILERRWVILDRNNTSCYIVNKSQFKTIVNTPTQPQLNLT